MSNLTASNDRPPVAFDRVFEAFEPFGRAFAPSVASKLLIYPTDPFGLDDEQLVALLAAADAAELQRVYVSAARPTDRPDDPNTWLLSPLGVRSYRQTLEPWTIVPHAIYPSVGSWGVMTSNESYAVAGGSTPFIKRMLRALDRDEDEMIAAWLDQWADIQAGSLDGGRSVATWVPTQLADVIGPERAEHALRASRLRLPA